MPSYWLVKTEPTAYAWADLERERVTRWTGVTNPLAKKHLRAMKPDDSVLVYHSGKERQVVGTAKVTAAGDEPELSVQKALPRPVTLAEIKARQELADWALVRLGRLSVLPVTDAEWNWVVAAAHQ